MSQASEIENSRRCDRHPNYVSRNTGGILVFDLPGLPVIGRGQCGGDEQPRRGQQHAQFRPARQYRRGRAAAARDHGDGQRKGLDRGAISSTTTPPRPSMVIAYTQAYDDAR